MEDKGQIHPFVNTMAADGMATQRTRSSAALVLVLFCLLNILDFKKRKRGLILELAAVLFLKYSQYWANIFLNNRVSNTKNTMSCHVFQLVSKCSAVTNHGLLSAHCDSLKACLVRNLGQHWFRQWLDAYCYQAITRTNVYHQQDPPKLTWGL